MYRTKICDFTGFLSGIMCLPPLSPPLHLYGFSALFVTFLLYQFNSLFLVQIFHQSHASERTQNKNEERKQKRFDANHNKRKECMQWSDQSL